MSFSQYLLNAKLVRLKLGLKGRIAGCMENIDVLSEALLMFSFVVGGTEVLYLFKQTTFADHAPNEDILKALGIQQSDENKES